MSSLDIYVILKPEATKILKLWVLLIVIFLWGLLHLDFNQALWHEETVCPVYLPCKPWLSARGMALFALTAEYHRLAHGLSAWSWSAAVFWPVWNVDVYQIGRETEWKNAVCFFSFLPYPRFGSTYRWCQATGMCACACMRACVRACVRACARVRACVRACVCVCVKCMYRPIHPCILCLLVFCVLDCPKQYSSCR